MELVDGPTLADALQAAHGQGIIHRDLKPGNVKISDDGVVKLLDSSLAKTAEKPAGAPTARRRRHSQIRP